MQQSAILQSFANQECFSTDYFENQDLEALLCPIGLGIVNNPVFDPCGHVFCKTCIHQWLDKQKICPINNSVLTKDQLVPALSVRNLILNLNLKLCLNGCEWKGKLEFYEKHFQNDCPEMIMNCANENCEEKIKRKNLQEHLNKDCLHKLMICELCDTKIEINKLQDHLDVCPQRIIECKMCHQEVTLNSMDKHVNENCEERQIYCQIQGCGQNVTFTKMESHLLQNKDHIILLQQQITNLDEQLQEQKAISVRLQERLDQKKDPPFLDGYRLSFTKKEQSREWNSINSMQKIGSYFNIKIQVTGLQARSNSWRSVVGIGSKRLNQYLWYKSENTFVWIMGGLKCQGNMSPEPYGDEVQGDFTVTMTLNRNCELIFSHNFNCLGTAFKIDQEIVDEGFYLLLSCINAGKFRIIHLEQL